MNYSSLTPEGVAMNYDELFEKYQALLVENQNLKKEVERLQDQLCSKVPTINPQEISIDGFKPEINAPEAIRPVFYATINNMSAPEEKIQLFMSLFKGRDDVYAKRWENHKKGTAGYSPCCLNEWKPGLCNKPKFSCFNCKNKAYDALDEKVIDDHLRGRKNFVAGIYPLCLDETCYFLAIDFDGEGWERDISVLRVVCSEFKIPLSVERSRSGNGAHAWFFFENSLPATLARKFGSALLTCCMAKRHEIKFNSYDRLFPNQDTMPKGGLGNLIALPLQKAARRNNNTEFIDANKQPYSDQWAYLSVIRKLSEKDVEILAAKLCRGNELGELRTDEESPKPWEVKKIRLPQNAFPQNIAVVRANMLFVPKAGISPQVLNYLKRLAAFKNPEFYKAQALRLPVKQLPRVISCSDEIEEYLCLPRGCEADLKKVFKDQDVGFHFVDETNGGKTIDVEFNGDLRDEQPAAIDQLLKYENGILCGTTAFGKTVVAINLIAQRKVNTLIIVDKVNLASQWRKKIGEFLTINEALPDKDKGKKRGRKKSKSIIGQLGAGKKDLSGIIDIAVMQSLNRRGEVKECVKDYGMVIVDECHHVSSFTFEQVLKNVNAKYVYGLTATPTRKDGHHPIISMQCGPIRYRDDAKKQAEKRPFEHYIIPRFTSFRVPMDKDEKDMFIQDLYSEIIVNEMRNQLIIDDVIRCHEDGRNCIVLTQRTAHVKLLVKLLGKKISDVIPLMGGMGAKTTRETLKLITDAPSDKQLTIVATGKYIGEGFDEPRLDTLFLAMPISWKGTLQQYAGRLHRLCHHKDEVQIYDYVDIHVRMLDRMYHKRLSGYASIGYKAKSESVPSEPIDIIFNKTTFLPVYSNDIVSAAREILIVSPFVTKKRSLQMLQNLEVAIGNNIKVIVVTRPVTDFKDRGAKALQGTLDSLKNAGIAVIFKSNIHQKFAVIDQKLVWYGSINLLSYGSAEESIMRLESFNIASELIKSIGVRLE